MVSSSPWSGQTAGWLCKYSASYLALCIAGGNELRMQKYHTPPVAEASVGFVQLVSVDGLGFCLAGVESLVPFRGWADQPHGPKTPKWMNRVWTGQNSEGLGMR